jgi:hypothetical protein
MRALFIFLLVLLMPSGNAMAGDVDYSKIDYTKFARAERMQLTKCFLDVLEVAKRHSLRGHLTGFLEAACAKEMLSYENALVSDPPPGVEFLEKDTKKKFLAMTFIGNMESAADGLYSKDDKQMPICSGDACVLDSYRTCLYLQLSEVIAKRAKPRDFENVAQQKCRAQESAARSKLIGDFVTVQKQQFDRELSQKTRGLIEEVISDIRHKIVVSYAEDLVKVQPGRKSCKPEMCGDYPCISLDPDPEPQPEYKCAISN